MSKKTLNQSCLVICLFTTCIMFTLYCFKEKISYVDAYQSQTSISDCKEKVIALTFDDGPKLKYLPQILEVLKKYKVKATFFFIGSNVVEYPNLARLVFNDGHEIGNHTFNHVNIRKLTEVELRNEIERTQKVIFLATGQTTRLFRPPGGEYNQKNLDFLKTTQYKMILWSWDQDTKDWKGPGVNKIVKKVLKNASDGDIVLFHDTMSQTVKALKVILPQLKKEGYRFVTVSELMQLKPSHSRIF